MIIKEHLGHQQPMCYQHRVGTVGQGFNSIQHWMCFGIFTSIDYNILYTSNGSEELMPNFIVYHFIECFFIKFYYWKVKFMTLNLSSVFIFM